MPNGLGLRFKCPNCKARGHTLHEQRDGEFYCARCKHVEPKDFWRTRFEQAAPLLTLREASVIIDAARNGSTLRRAILANKIKTQRKGYKYLITREELIKFYCYKFHKRLSRVNGNGLY